jgi:hypothetical protein
MLLSAESPNRGSLCTWGFKGHAAALNWSGANSPAGVGLEHGKRMMKVPQELGRTLFAPRRITAGDTGSPTPGLGGALVRQGANSTSETEVPPSEGNEVRWDGSRAS